MSPGPHPSNSPPLRVPVLDVLRAMAVLAVFSQHLGDRFRPFVLEKAAVALPGWTTLWLRTLLERGHWGVDLFFVLSGFTLGMGFVRDHDRGATRPAAWFFSRRAARILPAFFVALLVHLVARPDTWHSPALARSLATHALLLQGYLSPGGIVLIGASWSLTTESHFYLAAPWLARRLLHRSSSHDELNRKLLLLCAVTLAICLPVWLLRGTLHDLALRPDAPAGLLELSQRRWFVCRIDQFALGLAAAIAHHRLTHARARVKAMSWALVAAGAVALLLAAPLDHLTWPLRGGAPAYALVSLAMTAIVLGAALLPYPRRSVALEPLRFLGVVSYGFFLYHQLAIELVARWIAPAAAPPAFSSLLWSAVPALLLAVLAGWLSWILIESPALEWASRNRKVAIPAQDASA